MLKIEEINNPLFDKFRALCKEIPKETLLMEAQIRLEIAESNARDTRGENLKRKGGRRGFRIRLTTEQQNQAIDGFQSFFNKRQEYIDFYKQRYGSGAKLHPFYDVFSYTILALESVTRSLFVCLRCGELDSVNNLKTVKRVAYHKCEDGELGRGNRTSWLVVYATFVRNEKMQEAFIILDRILDTMVKVKNL